MKFHLDFPVRPLSSKIKYTDPLLFIGSCFAENIGQKMRDLKFNAIINPNGIIYNPISISNSIRDALNNKQILEKELFFGNELWNSWDHHSRFSQADKTNAVCDINTSVLEAHQQIKKAQWLFITFGSAFVYRLRSTGEIVSNCHKQPSKDFDKQLLTAEEILKTYTQLIKELRSANPDLKIVFTVSPVRYIRDGVVENNLSKSILIQSVHELIQLNSNSFYFPAYEIVIDDLRDYRFYESDLVHPNQLALGHVFDKWKTSALEEDTLKLSEQISEIRIASKHRSFQKGSEATKKFKAAYLQKSIELQTKYSFLDLKTEIEYFKK